MSGYEEGGEAVSRCPACGDVIDYCQGHGEIGDWQGWSTLRMHDAGDHGFCVHDDNGECVAL